MALTMLSIVNCFFSKTTSFTTTKRVIYDVVSKKVLKDRLRTAGGGNFVII